MTLASPRAGSRLQLFSHACAMVVVGIGSAVLIGWSFEIPILKTGLPGLITMKANTAIGFLMAGLAVLFARSTTSVAGVRIRLPFTAAVLALGCSTLFEHIFNLNLGIDELLFYDDPTIPGVTLRGRMSPVSAVGFCLAGLSLFFLNRRGRRFQRWALWCAVPVSLLAVQAIMGYAYGVRALFQVLPFSALAIHTAMAFLLLSMAIFTAAPTQGFMKIITSATAGGFVARRLLPFSLVGLFGLGWICVGGEEQGWFDERFGNALMALLAMAFCVGIVLWHAGVLYRVDLERSVAEAEIVALNESLEQKVHVRTMELQKALHDVKQLSGLLPICAWCRMVRDDHDYWQSVEGFIASHTDAKFTHGVCPTCYAKALAEDSWQGE
jgi:hypothetical protein